MSQPNPTVNVALTGRQITVILNTFDNSPGFVPADIKHAFIEAAKEQRVAMRIERKKAKRLGTA